MSQPDNRALLRHIVEQKLLQRRRLDADRDTVQAIARDLRARFRQESVLVTEDRIVGFFVSEDPA